MSSVCDKKEWTGYVGVIIKLEIRGTPTSKIQSILLQLQNHINLNNKTAIPTNWNDPSVHVDRKSAKAPGAL
jgi:hypothetical protein